MPRPRKDLDQFRKEIERRIANHDTQTQIRSWLAKNGLTISKNTLSTRLVAWQANRSTRTASSDPALMSGHFRGNSLRGTTVAPNLAELWHFLKINCNIFLFVQSPDRV